MGKRLLIISLVILLTLAMLAPVATMASGEDADPLHCEGVIDAIEPTIIGENVFPLPDGTWWVDDREIWGTFASGDVVGPFTLTYDAIILDAWTQEGTFWGTLEAWDDEDQDSRVFEVIGSLEPGEIISFDPLMLKVTVHGEWSLIENGEVYGMGNLESWAIIEVDWIGGEPHAGEIVDSAIDLTGLWDNQANDDDQ